MLLLKPFVFLISSYLRSSGLLLGWLVLRTWQRKIMAKTPFFLLAWKVPYLGHHKRITIHGTYMHNPIFEIWKKDMLSCFIGFFYYVGFIYFPIVCIIPAGLMTVLSCLSHHLFLFYTLKCLAGSHLGNLFRWESKDTSCLHTFRKINGLGYRPNCWAESLWLGCQEDNSRLYNCFHTKLCWKYLLHVICSISEDIQADKLMEAINNVYKEICSQWTVSFPVSQETTIAIDQYHKISSE